MSERRRRRKKRRKRTNEVVRLDVEEKRRDHGDGFLSREVSL